MLAGTSNVKDEQLNIFKIEAEDSSLQQETPVSILRQPATTKDDELLNMW